MRRPQAAYSRQFAGRTVVSRWVSRRAPAVAWRASSSAAGSREPARTVREPSRSNTTVMATCSPGRLGGRWCVRAPESGPGGWTGPSSWRRFPPGRMAEDSSTPVSGGPGVDPVNGSSVSSPASRPAVHCGGRGEDRPPGERTVPWARCRDTIAPPREPRLIRGAEMSRSPTRHGAARTAGGQRQAGVGPEPVRPPPSRGPRAPPRRSSAPRLRVRGAAASSAATG